jgi:hypothetical protein
MLLHLQCGNDVIEMVVVIGRDRNNIDSWITENFGYVPRRPKMRFPLLHSLKLLSRPITDHRDLTSRVPLKTQQVLFTDAEPDDTDPKPSVRVSL